MPRLNCSRLFPVLLMLAATFSACTQEPDQAADKKDELKDTAYSAPVDSLIITLVGADSISVLELLRADHYVEVHQSAMGSFVKAIDSIENAQGYFWLYSVNDSAGKVAADKFLTSDSDIVLWHYRKIGE